MKHVPMKLKETILDYFDRLWHEYWKEHLPVEGKVPLEGETVTIIIFKDSYS